MSKTIYLDYAAATPMSDEVLAAMKPYFQKLFHNPSATYLAAREIQSAVSNSRERVAKCLGAKSNEIIFTAGGTEANNLAIRGAIDKYGGKVLVSAIEHDSVLEPALEYGGELIPVDEAGVIRTELLEDLITDETTVVSVMYANNEVGTIQPLKQLAKVLDNVRQDRAKRDVKQPLIFHTDACQAANYLDLHVSSLGVDLMTMNGGKIYGAKQSGVLYKSRKIELAPQVLGGGQEKSYRSGTENVAQIIGLAEALENAQGQKDVESERLADLQVKFIEKLSAKIPSAKINGSLRHRLVNNVHITIPGADNERLIMELDEQGIQCAAGSACSASDEEPSHVLRAMGVSEQDAQASIRFSFGRHTTETDLIKTADVLAQLL